MTQNLPKKSWTILLAEDEDFIAMLYKMNLERKGGTVILAHNGKEVLSLLPTCKPDLLLLDLLMPEMNGIEVLEHLQKQEDKPPIIVLSNASQDVDKEQCKTLGARDFIVKSNMDIESLWRKIVPFLPQS